MRLNGKPNLIGPEHPHTGSAIHPEGRCVVLLAASSSHKSIAA
jgi:hypothetical protein